MSFRDLAEGANLIFERTFSTPVDDPILYQQPPDAPFALAAIRGMHDPLENEQLAAFERIWARVGNFPNTPKPGDWVWLGETAYVVHIVKPDEDPASDGFKIYLNRRAPTRPNA